MRREVFWKSQSDGPILSSSPGGKASLTVLCKLSCFAEGPLQQPSHVRLAALQEEDYMLRPEWLQDRVGHEAKVRRMGHMGCGISAMRVRRF